MKTCHCSAYCKPLAHSRHFVICDCFVFALASSHICRPAVHKQCQDVFCVVYSTSAFQQSVDQPSHQSLVTGGFTLNGTVYTMSSIRFTLRCVGTCSKAQNILTAVQKQVPDCCSVTCSIYQVFGICRYKRHSCKGVKGKSPGVPTGQRGIMQTHKELHNKSTSAKHKPPICC